MASEKLKKILAMSQNIDKKGNKPSSAPKRTIKAPASLHERINNANKTIANIDEMYNSPYIPTKEEKEAWNCERGRDELNEMANNSVFMEKLNQSKLPAAIVESMRKNPCNYDAAVVDKMMGPENALFKKLNEVYGKEKEEPVRGVKAIQQINEQLETRDKQTNVKENIINEDAVMDNKSCNNVDLSTLEQIIERVIDRKLGELNESISRKMSSTVRSMSITESGNFRFLDNEDNVYECQMKYLGKRKKETSVLACLSLFIRLGRACMHLLFCSLSSLRQQVVHRSL